MVNDRVKRVERGSARAAEQVFRTPQLDQTSLAHESELKVARNFSTFADAKART